MPEKYEEPTALESLGWAVDDNAAIARAVRSGKLTRSRFDRWYKKRSTKSIKLIIKMREAIAATARPALETASLQRSNRKKNSPK